VKSLIEYVVMAVTGKQLACYSFIGLGMIDAQKVALFSPSVSNIDEN